MTGTTTLKRLAASLLAAGGLAALAVLLGPAGSAAAASQGFDLWADSGTATMPPGIAEAPPITVMALPGCSVVPDANVWRTAVLSLSVQPLTSMALPPMLTISTPSPAPLLPGSLASTSLMMTLAGVPPLPALTVTFLVVVAVAPPLSVTLSVTG